MTGATAGVLFHCGLVVAEIVLLVFIVVIILYGFPDVYSDIKKPEPGR